MNKFSALSVIITLVLCCAIVQECLAQSPKTEFRATWFTTHYGIDWPKTRASSATTITKQQQEMTTILDQLQAGNMNATCFQARPVADAFYRSSYEPWSHILTGKRGQDPGYDPLAYAVEQAHARGMELHAWVNPFRYEITAGERTTAINNGTALAGTDPIRTAHPDWLLTYNNGTFSGSILDPGNPEARAYVVKVLLEIVNNYDIDGMLMDDYFYPYGGTTTEDASSKAKYKPSGMSDGDWRRENVNKVIKAVYDSIQQVKPWVKFGMAPGGIYSMTEEAAAAYGLTLPSGISGGDIWKTLYCDALAWIDGGYVDYMAPQVYWSTTAAKQDYDVLCEWWGKSITTLNGRRSDGKRVHSYISQASYRFGPNELAAEIDANRRYSPYDAPGSIFYNTNTYLKFTESGTTEYSCATLAQTRFTQRALPPAVTWKEHPALTVPTDLALSGTTLSWQHPSAERFSVYAYPKGTDRAAALAGSQYLVQMVYGRQLNLSSIANLGDKTIAVCAMDRYGNEYEAALLNEGEPVLPPEPEEGTLSRTELWRKTAAQTGYMATNANRSIACYDGKIYIADGANSRYYILNAANGEPQQTVDLPEKYFVWHNLRITEDGMLLAGNSGTGSNYQYVYSSPAGSGTPSEAATYNNSGFGRTDYFYPFGAYSGSGFLLTLSNTSHQVLKMSYGNGAMGSATLIAHDDLPTGTSAKALPKNSESFFASAAQVLPTVHNLATGAKIDDWTGSVKPAKVDVSGLAYFALGGHEYLLLPSDIYGGFATYDITDGLSQAEELLSPTSALGAAANATFTVDFAVNIEGYDAYVYVLAPNNGIAAYKYTFTPKSTSVEQPSVSHQQPMIEKRLTPKGLVIVVRAQGEERVYTPMGIRVQ